jgi:uncharacterized protein YxjI
MHFTNLFGLLALAVVHASPIINEQPHGLYAPFQPTTAPPPDLYVDWNGVQFTNKQGETLYKAKPLAKVSIFTTDFDIKDAKNQVVAKVREKLMAMTHQWNIEFYDEFKGSWSTCNIKFPFFRYLATIKVNGRRFKIQGDFLKHEFEIVSEDDQVTHAESELQSRLVMGAGNVDLFKLSMDGQIPAPLVVAIHRIGYYLASGEGADTNRGLVKGAIAGVAIAAASSQSN